MTFLQYAQKIMEGCGNFEGYKCVEKYVRDKGLCPSCQRARQTAIDLGKMFLIHLQRDYTPCCGLEYVDECNCFNCDNNELEIKDIQEGLKVLGVEA